MWEYVIGGATVFGLIVGLFSIYNGRASRRVVIEGERRTQEILRKHNELLEKLSEQHETMIKQHGTMIEILKSTQTRKDVAHRRKT